MPLILESHDSLPYIDVPVSQAERDQANALISKETSADNLTVLHPSLAPLAPTKFSEIMAKEIERVETGEPRTGGIDLSRYEAPDEPAEDSDVQAWRNALRMAYTSSSYLSARHMNLALLEELGKNAWLISNSQLEQILKNLEDELARLKEETESVNKARKAAQEGSKGEMLGLGETWRREIGKIIEVQVATDGLRREILERRRSSVR